MTVRRWCWVVLGLVAFAVAGAGEAQAERRVIPPRPGQIGLGLQGQVGTLLKTGNLGDEFGAGPGLTVRVRYRMRYERGFGLSFESQTFDIRTQADSALAITDLKLILSGLELYQMFGTRTNTHRMVSVGFGLAQVSQDTRGGGTVFPGDGLYVSAGAGLEHFFWNSWAWDFSTRYMAVFQDGNTNHDVQLSLGLIFYATY